MGRSGNNSGNRYFGVILALVVSCSVGIAHAQIADMRLAALPAPSASDSVAALPASSPRFLDDASFVVELWARTSDASGLSSASADISFTNGLCSVAGITHSATFSVLTAGSINNVAGTIDNLSGSHLGPCTDAVGVTPNWARVAILSVSANGQGSATFQTAPTGSAIYGTAICGVGNLADAQVAYGSVTVDLVECLADADCGDDQFCNGVETCNLSTFNCEPGIAPNCGDGVDCTLDSCDFAGNAGLGACIHVPDHTICDNALFCDGAETCDALQGCLPGTAPCTEECEHCEESTDTCDLCGLDLDGTGVMGTGDFSLFAPCFGACYGPGDPCRASNFDEDAGGCVGTSDFAAFVGCFGYSCGQCGACAGPGGGGAVAAVDMANETFPAVSVRVVPLRLASTSNVRDALPESQPLFHMGDRIYLELWVAAPSGPFANDGLASAYVDVQVDSGLSILDVIPSAMFGLLTNSEVGSNAGLLRAVGGCAPLDAHGVGGDGQWMKLATVVARAMQPGDSELVLHCSDDLHGFARPGMFSNMDSSMIDLRGARVTVQKPVRATPVER